MSEASCELFSYEITPRPSKYRSHSSGAGIDLKSRCKIKLFNQDPPPSHSSKGYSKNTGIHLKYVSRMGSTLNRGVAVAPRSVYRGRATTWPFFWNWDRDTQKLMCLCSQNLNFVLLMFFYSKLKVKISARVQFWAGEISTFTEASEIVFSQ